jgi:hypothetical protein
MEVQDRAVYIADAKRDEVIILEDCLKGLR